MADSSEATASIAPPQLVPAVLPMTLVTEVRKNFKDGKSALIQQFRDTRPTTSSATRLIHQLAQHVDETLMKLWRVAGLPQGYSLIAVGGYGRGELFPASDVDVLVLLPNAADQASLELNPSDVNAQTESIERFITLCWDVGLEIGSSVRTLDECVHEAQADVTIQTALLEARFLVGSKKLFQSFLKSTLAVLDPKDYLVAKTLEMNQRHARFEDTPYALEPNCKESPGGLRDLQVLVWVARAAGLGKNWRVMAQNGLITPFEMKQLERNEGVLKLIRARLHMVAGRREDRLIFDLQTAVAESFGYENTSEQRASEALMHRYYWAAKAVTQLNQIVLLNIEERIHDVKNPSLRRIDDNFLDRDGMLEIASDDLYQKDPTLILKTFIVYQQEVGIEGLSAKTLRALYNARSVMNAEFRHDPRNRESFMQILKEPAGHTHVFRLLNQTSVLGRYLWVFRRIVGKMQHDLFHVYTVDQHILMVLRNMRRFFIAEHAHEYPFCSQLASQWDKPWVLYVAALFHDVAKGRGGDHSDLGAIEVRRFCQDHQIDLEDAKLIEFLVQQHLTLSRVAQKEDLSDPDVIQNFAQIVKTPRYLTALYLLTVADIRGTSPKVWNAWKGKLLEDLFRATLHALGGGKPNVDATIETNKNEARRLMALYSMLPGSEESLWKTLELSYFLRHDAEDIAWHTRCLGRHTETEHPIVRVRMSSIGEGLQVVVYAPDQPDLFARICGYFDNAGFNILDAKVHTTTAGYALDTFLVISQHLQDHYRELTSMVQSQLSEALLSQKPLPEPSQGRLSRRIKSFPVTPRVSLRPDDRAQRWLLSVSASDRSGLLYSIARVLARHGINLQLAKITTLGERVEDTFLVNGPGLQNHKHRIQVETDLLEVLDVVR